MNAPVLAVFPSYCVPCDIRKDFGTALERLAFELEHQHGGVD